MKTFLKATLVSLLVTGFITFGAIKVLDLLKAWVQSSLVEAYPWLLYAPAFTVTFIGVLIWAYAGFKVRELRKKQ